MSLERALVAIEAIAAALTTIAANTAASPTAMQRDSQVDTGKAAVAGENKPAPEKTTKRERPAKTDVVKAEGIKSEDKATALVVAEALFGDQKGDAAPVAPVAEVMDYEILKRAVLEVGSYSEAGRQGVIKLLGDYGIKNAKDLKPELREEFHGILLGILTDLQNAESNNDDGGEFA